MGVKTMNIKPILQKKRLDRMTKKEIVALLKEYGIDATLRPRKSTLVALAEATIRKVVETGSIHDATSPVTAFDDIYDFAKKNGDTQMKVTTEEWMEFTKVDHKLNKSETALVICVSFLVILHAVMIGAAIYA